MKRRILSIVTALALCLGLCPTWAFAVEEGADAANVPMLADVAVGDVAITETNGQTITFTAKQCVGSCQGHTITQNVSSGVAQNTTILVESGNHNITFSGLNLRFAKVGVMPGATMNLTIVGTNSISASANMAGIYVPVGATLVITQQSTGSLDVSGDASGAGIGGSYYVTDPTNPVEDQRGDLNCGTVMINGGTITATGGSMSAGIGGAAGSYGSPIPGNGGTVTINGGTVMATGGSDDGYYGGAGIGGGSYDATNPSGCGGILTINGGKVTMTAGNFDAQCPAYGFGQGSGRTPSGPCELILADADCLADGTTLDPKGTYTLNGDPTADMIAVPTGLIYNGQDQTEAAKAAISLVSTGNETKEFLGRTFRLIADIAGWDYTIFPEVVQGAGEYTVTYTKDGKTISKTFTVEQSGTEFKGDGAAKAYLMGTEQYTFSVDDPITVIATPTATGQAPANAAMMASITEPTGGQMALFVGDKQVSEPVDAKPNGSYSMMTTAQDVLAAAGELGTIELIARFVESGNQAGAESKVKITITAVAKVTTSGVTYYYGTIDDAWNAAKGKTATVTLLDNVTVTGNPMLQVNGGNVTFDGGEHILTLSGAFHVNSGTLTIIGGTISAPEGLGFHGDVLLRGGAFESGGYIVFSDGKPLLNLLDNSDGTYRAFYKNGQPVPLEANQNSLPAGTYTVAECRHDENVCEYQPLNGTETHKMTCLACGYTEAADCTYGTEYESDETNHWQFCTVCNGQKSEAHTIDLITTAVGSTVTLRRGCATCGYGETVGTVTFAFPELTYGQTEGDLTWTAVPDGYTMELRIDDKAESTVSGGSKNLAELYGAGEKMPGGNHALKVCFMGAGETPKSNDSELTFTVARAELTPVIDASGGTTTKTYDGTPAAPDGLTITLNGIVSGDAVTATATSYTYNSPNVKDANTITASGIILSGEAAGNYMLTSSTATIQGSITKSAPTLSLNENYKPDKTYDGQTITNPTADDLTITGADYGDVVFEWKDKNGETSRTPPKNAGTYTLTISIPATDNTEAAGPVEKEVWIRRAELTISSATVESKTYDGSPRTNVTAMQLTGMVNGETLIFGEDYSAYGIFEDANAGGNKDVTVYMAEMITEKAENYGFSNPTFQTTGTITAKPLAGATANISGEFSYTGEALSPEPAVTLDGKTLVKDTDYTTTYTDNMNVGTATVTITGKGNYSGTVTITFDIAKAKLTAAGTGIASGTYGAKLSELTITGLTVTRDGDGADISGTWKLSGETIPNVGDEGTYTAVFTPANGGDNYIPLTAQVKLKIAKAQYKGTVTASTSAKFGTTATYDLTALLPAGATAGTSPTASGDIFEGDPSVSGKTLSYGLKADAAVGTTGTITVPVTSTNYEDFNLTITVTVSDKDVPTLTIDPITVTYNGKPVPDTAIKGTAKVGDTTVSGTWNFVGTAPTNVADSGTKAVKFTPADPAKYAEVEGTVTVTINKATPTGAPKYTAISTSGKKLSDAGLTTEGGTFSVPGTVAWVLSADTEVKTNIDYEWVFTPTDSANYNTLTGKIRLWNYTQPSNPGGGNNYVPSNPGTSSLPVTTTGQNSSIVTTTTTAAPTASTSGGKATTTVDTAMGNEIVKQAVANKSEDIVIAPKVTGNVSRTEVSIPAATVGQIGSQTNASLTIATPVADVTIPNGGLGSLSSAGGTVTVTAEKSGNMVELSVTTNGRTVDYVPGGLTLTVPAYTTPGTVAVLVNVDGTREVVRKSVADNGSVTIPLDGSAKVEIVDNSKYFYDVPSTSWAADAVAFASAHELFNGTGANQFSPNLPMSRGMLATVLHNLESNPYQPITSVFADVNNSEWYAEGVAWAATHGIVGGYGNGQFGPNDNITREQLAVMLWRYAGSPAATDRELHFADAYRASSWALDALRWATENGVMNGKGNGILDPGGQATRAETAQMLKNFMGNQ